MKRASIFWHLLWLLSFMVVLSGCSASSPQGGSVVASPPGQSTQTEPTLPARASPFSTLVVTHTPARGASQTSCTRSFVPSPNVGSRSNVLDGVTAIASNDVWAVGYYLNTTLHRDQTLVEHWNGVSWSVKSSPNPGSSFNLLFGVSANATNDVWAVGESGSQTLVEHWNGVSWRVVSSPNPGSHFNFFDGVSAVASNDVWAVGEAGSQTLVEHWNGVSWRAVSSSSPGSHFSVLRGVSANATNDVWAVGGLFNTGGSGDQTLVEHWNGVSWRVVPDVDVGSGFNELFGVTTIAHDDVWAVGGFKNTGTNQLTRPLTEHWNGVSWRVVPNPAANYKGFGGDLRGVAATNRHGVWTAGESFHNTIDQTLTERWTPDTGWHVLSNPPIGTSFSFLDAVSALKAKSGPAVVWAVGFFRKNIAPEQTLTELIVC